MQTHIAAGSLSTIIFLSLLSPTPGSWRKLFVCHSFWGLHVAYNNLIITEYILFKLHLLATGPNHLLLCCVLLHLLHHWFSLNSVHFSENSSWSSHVSVYVKLFENSSWSSYICTRSVYLWAWACRWVGVCVILQGGMVHVIHLHECFIMKLLVVSCGSNLC